ncbi:MAG: Rieske (2Fe-2S) domain protein, partial [Chloroflexi bacterium]|nr:Rieske (2Fe-2S) domain protein [Chloroflexota bacterium]
MAAMTASMTEQDYPDFVHTGPGTLAGRYIRTFWQPLYRAKDLPAGKAVPVRLLGEDLTLFRGETGTAHVFQQRCAHRGTQLN